MGGRLGEASTDVPYSRMDDAICSIRAAKPAEALHCGLELVCVRVRPSAATDAISRSGLARDISRRLAPRVTTG